MKHDKKYTWIMFNTWLIIAFHAISIEFALLRMFHVLIIMVKDYFKNSEEESTNNSLYF